MNVLEKLPDSEDGEGELPDDFAAHCVLCGDELREDQEIGKRFGKFVHMKCNEEFESRGENSK